VLAAHQRADVAGLGVGAVWLSAATAGVLTAFVDAGVVVVQLLIGGFKLALALFLF